MDSRSLDPSTTESGSRRRDRDFSGLGKALASPTRSVMLSLLMDGTVRPAGELARAAGVSASTASEHLSVLVDARLVTCTARGRGRYYRLRGPEVAHALETLGHIAPAAPATGYTGVRAAERLASGRFCYDHLAGRLGCLLRPRGWVAAGLARRPRPAALSRHSARDGFFDLGVDITGLDALRRPTTRACLDWTERRPPSGRRTRRRRRRLCFESGVDRAATRPVAVYESPIRVRQLLQPYHGESASLA